MDKLQKDLKANLSANPEVSVVNDAIWQLPLVSYNVSFGRVKRFKMDILMKMLLLAFQETDIRRAAALADMLLVEELFIRDSMEKMERTGLIELDQKGYKLTVKGTDYLEKGIFDDEMEGDQTLISYSAVHDEYLLVKGDEAKQDEGALPLYRYAVKGTLNKDRMQQFLSSEMVYAEEEGFQILVAEITGCIEHGTHFIPCLEFQLYDRKQDIFFARIWNTLTGSWDEKLAKGIEEREVVKWRKTMEEQEPALGT